MKINSAKNWQEIANAFETPDRERTEWQRKIAGHGLCRASAQLGNYSNDIRKLGCIMGIITPYWWAVREWSMTEERRFTRSVDHERATFAYLMAAIGNREYGKLIKG